MKSTIFKYLSITCLLATLLISVTTSAQEIDMSKYSI
jgi:hypothetical protein